MTKEEAEKYADNMTYRDAINNLMKAKSIPYRKATFIKVNKLLKVLEQESCGDTISRHATVERLCKVAEFMNEKREGLGSPYVMAALFIQDNKDEFPPIPITSQPKTGKSGKWEWGQYNYNPKFGNWHCSECGSVVIECVTKEEKGGIPLYKYCPQCGAKMQEESEKGK